MVNGGNKVIRGKRLSGYLVRAGGKKTRACYVKKLWNLQKDACLLEYSHEGFQTDKKGLRVILPERARGKEK